MGGFLLWLSQLATGPTVLCIISWGGLVVLVGSHSQLSVLTLHLVLTRAAGPGRLWLDPAFTNHLSSS